jgi:Kef-type K+ transport system membrane component KefB
MLLAGPVPPIAAHSLVVFLLQVGGLLLVALVLGRLAARCGMPAVVGELSAGMVLGPSLLGHAVPGFSAWLLPQQSEQFHLLDAVGQLGVVLLVALTGIEMDFGLVRRRGTTAARVSLAGLILPLGLGIGTGFLLPDSMHGPDRTAFALFLGVAMAVTAIPVIAKILIDMGLLYSNIGQLTLAAGMVDDVVGWLLLSVVSAMATTGVRAENIALSLLYLALVLGFAVLPGRWIARQVVRLGNRAADPGPTVAATVVMALLGAAATHAMGLEAVFGAFVVGILVGTWGGIPPARVAPLRTAVGWVLAPIFFATAGLRMDLTALKHPVVLAAAVAVLLIAILGKFAGAYLGARISRLNRWEGLALGAGMNARGVIEVVVAMVGLRLGVLTTQTYTIVILVAIVTSLMAPPILRLAMRRVEHTAEERLRAQARQVPLMPVQEEVH